MWSYTVPSTVFEKIVGGFIQQTAIEVLELRARGGVLHPGDPFGQFLAWVWANHSDEAPNYVADLLAGIRYHARGADRTVTLDELLDGLPFALSTNMATVDADALISALRTGVPKFFDADVTSRPGQG